MCIRDRACWIDSIASNAALLLETGLFDDLPDAARYIGGIVRRVCGKDFVTEVGIRCRALTEDGLVDFQDYHGTWAVWMKETHDVVRGLQRQALPKLAGALAVRLLNAVNVARANVEFLYVGPDQSVNFDFLERDRSDRFPTRIYATNVPEAPQAWTVTAALAVKRMLGSNQDVYPSALQERAATGQAWRRALDAEVVGEMPQASILRTSAPLEAAYARRGNYIIDRDLGARRDRGARSRPRGPGSCEPIA